MIKRNKAPITLRRNMVIGHGALVTFILLASLIDGSAKTYGIHIGILGILIFDVYLIFKKPFQSQRNPTTMFAIRSPVVRKNPQTLQTPRYSINISALGTEYRSKALSAFEKTIDDIIDRYLEIVHQFCSAHTTAIFFETSQNSYQMRRFKSDCKAILKDTVFHQGLGVIGSFIKNEMQTMTIQDFSNKSTTLYYYSKHVGVRSLIICPILLQTPKRGFVVVDSTDKRHFTDDMVRFSENAAILCGEGLSYAYRYNQHRLDYERLVAMSTIEKEFFEQHDLDLVLDRIVAIIPFAFQCDRLSVCLINEEKEEGEVVRCWGNSSEHLLYLRFALCEKSIANVVYTKNVSLCRDFSPEYYEVRFTQQEHPVNIFTSFLAMPLGFNECKGIVLIENMDHIQYSDTSRELLSRLVAAAGIVIEKIQLLRQTEQLAIRDGLTGLCNRRHFQYLLEEAITQVLRYDQPLALIIADVDNFKRCNDTYGHRFGDMVLKKISSVLNLGVRETIDTVARFGGEEFAIIISGMKPDSVIECIEKLRRQIEDLRMQTPAGERFNCTLSFGIAFFGNHAKNTEQLIQKADKALYRAKDKGRNRVEIFSSPGTEPQEP